MTSGNFYRVVLVTAGAMDYGDNPSEPASSVAVSELVGSKDPAAEYLGKLRAVIHATHGCDAVHALSSSVKESRHGKTWEGRVEVFALARHPQANRCYAWGQRQPNGEWDVTTVLATPPIDSPEAAVRSTL